MDRHIRIHRGIFFLILAGVVTATSASVSSGSWYPFSQVWGGPVGQIIIDPVNHRNLFATGGPGVLESTDQGGSWKPILSLPAGALAAGPKGTKTLYAGSYGDGVWRSADDGKTWQNASTGLPAGTNFGTTWDYIEALAADPQDNGVVYAVTFGHGVYKTSDGGTGWVAINSGISNLIGVNGNISIVTVDPVAPQTLYLGYISNAGIGSGLVYRSTDGGTSWSQTAYAGGPVEDLAIDPSHHTTLYVAGGSQGLYVSTDSGAAWSSISLPAADAIDVAVDPFDSEHLWVGGFNHGLYVSTDGGAHWAQGPNEAAGFIADITADPAQSGVVYANSGSALMRSTDGGNSWMNLVGGIPAPGAQQMVVDGRVMYVGTASGVVYKTTDQGIGWSALASGASYPEEISSLAQDPNDSATLYAASAFGIFKTTDGGAQWTLLDNGIPTFFATAVAVDSHDSQLVYAISSGFYKSTDGGASWQPVEIGSNISPNGIISMAVDPSVSGVVYAGTGGTELFKSIDAGATWSPLGSPTSQDGAGVADIAINPRNSRNIYLTSSLGRAVYKSTDGGNTWSEISNGLPSGFAQASIQVDPRNPSILFAVQSYLDDGFLGHGAYVSYNGGAQWQPMDTGLSAVRSKLPGIARPQVITAIGINPSTGQVYGVGSDSYIYTYSDPHHL